MPHGNMGTLDMGDMDSIRHSRLTGQGLDLDDDDERADGA
jgi:hypothetical protein